MQLASTLERFLEHCDTIRRLSTHTVRAYRCDLNAFEHFMRTQRGHTAVSLDSCARDDALAYVQHMSEIRHLQASTVRRRLACLKSFYGWLEREHHVVASPLQGLELRMRRPRRIPRALSTSDLQELLLHLGDINDLDPRNEYIRVSPPPSSARAFNRLTTLVMVEILLATGLRIGELASAELSRLDLQAGRLEVTGKGNRDRRVFLPSAALIRLMKHYLAARAPLASPGVLRLFITGQGRPASAQFLRAWLHRCAPSSPRRHITPHMLRHTCATCLLENGVDIRFVQRLLGHASIATTEIYTTVTDRALERQLVHANIRGDVLTER
jgi:site-specific recombinase XerD